MYALLSYTKGSEVYCYTYPINYYDLLYLVCFYCNLCVVCLTGSVVSAGGASRNSRRQEAMNSFCWCGRHTNNMIFNQ